MRGPTQVLSDCPHCRVESALVELVDPSERVGVALEGRCRLCGYGTELGEVIQLGQPFVAHDEVVEALARWAAEDGEDDVVVFAQANFNGRDPHAIAVAVLAGERVDTGFDVIAWLFPSMHGGGRRNDEDERPQQRVGPGSAANGTRIPAEPHRLPLRKTGGVAGAEPPPRENHAGNREDAHTVARALASVMLADGRIRDAERRFLDETLRRMNAPPLDPADLRVWRPTELGVPADPKAVIAAMRALALCDHEADGSERRVLEEYARAWRVPLPRDPLPRPGAMAELGRTLRTVFGG